MRYLGTARTSDYSHQSTETGHQGRDRRGSVLDGETGIDGRWNNQIHGIANLGRKKSEDNDRFSRLGKRIVASGQTRNKQEGHFIAVMIVKESGRIGHHQDREACRMASGTRVIVRSRRTSGGHSGLLTFSRPASSTILAQCW